MRRKTPKSITLQVPDHEKHLAAGIVFAAIFFPYGAPIVGLLLSGTSRLARYYSLRSLISQMLMTLFMLLVMICSISYSVYQLVRQGFDLSHFDWVTFIIKAVAIQVAFLVISFINLIEHFLGTFSAMKGIIRMPKHPVNRLALKWSGLKPVAALDALPGDEV